MKMLAEHARAAAALYEDLEHTDLRVPARLSCETITSEYSKGGEIEPIQLERCYRAIGDALAADKKGAYPLETKLKYQALARLGGFLENTAVPSNPYGGKAPCPSGMDKPYSNLTDDERKICRILGTDEKDYLEHKQRRLAERGDVAANPTPVRTVLHDRW